jgi:hypothetical protein
MVRIDAMVSAIDGMVEMVDTVMVCGAQMCYGPNIWSRHPRTTCATMCLVWNDLLTN